jgi:hypothetical protein
MGDYEGIKSVLMPQLETVADLNSGFEVSTTVALYIIRLFHATQLQNAVYKDFSAVYGCVYVVPEEVLAEQFSFASILSEIQSTWNSMCSVGLNSCTRHIVGNSLLVHSS